MTFKAKSGRKIHVPTAAEDAVINAGIAADEDNPEWSESDFAKAKPAGEFFGADVMAKLPRPRGRPRGSVAEVTKARLSMRVDPDVLEAMRAIGDGWQSRVNEVLRREFVRGRRVSKG